MVQETGPYGRLYGNFIRGKVGLLFRDDHVFELFAGVHVLKFHGRAYQHLIFRYLGVVKYLRVGKFGIEFGYLLFVHALRIFGGIILGVLAYVTVRPGLAYGLRKLPAFGGLQMLEFFSEFLATFRC